MFRSTTSTIILLFKISVLLCCILCTSIINYASAFSSYSSSPFVTLEKAGKGDTTSSISTTTIIPAAAKRSTIPATIPAITTRRERVVLSATTSSSAAASRRGKRIETKKDIEILLDRNRRVVNSLATVIVGNDNDNEENANDDDDVVVSEVIRLRFALAFETGWEAKIALQEALDYRKTTRGKAIMDAALQAYNFATKEQGKWNNDIVRDSAPHATLINKYVTSKTFVTLAPTDGDLVYVIRASLIDDTKLMNEVTVDQLSDFFLYVKEIHHLVANQRSEQTGRLCEVILANDITGVRKPPDPRFSKALSSSSAQYEKLYPSLAGPTMILNLPFILQAFASFFKPLFPKSIQKKLKFLRAPVLGSLRDLTPLAIYNGSKRQSFLLEIDKLLKQ